MRRAVVLFTRDLRVHDNPALAAACRAAPEVVPLFVFDPAIRSGPNRDAFLAGALADLRDSLRARGGDLLVGRGDPVVETLRVATAVAADGVAVAADVSGYARRRSRGLAAACESARISLRLFPGVTVVPPDALAHPYRVFTPYWRAWQAAPWRPVEVAPRRITLPETLPPGVTLEGAAAEGETAGRRRLGAWVRRAGRYVDVRDGLAADGTSKLSPYLHFGCVSPREVAARVDDEAYRRQLCWRDFYQQVLYSAPDLGVRALRPGAAEQWRDDPDAFDAWRTGQTGVPIVDAGMRQLAAEGWMHNRGRLVTASFLTKYLRLDWRAGAAHFADLLLDADVASNNGNWQWVAGTGTDTRPYRRFNPIRQAERFDPDGDYVRRYVPELGSVDGGAVHRPWRLPPAVRRTLDYPDPLDGAEPATWLDGDGDGAAGRVTTKRAPGSASS